MEVRLTPCRQPHAGCENQCWRRGLEGEWGGGGGMMGLKSEERDAGRTHGRDPREWG